MEGRALITEALLASGESAEVLGGLGDGLAVEAHDNAAEGLVTLLNVEVDLVGDLGALRCLGGLRKEQHRAEEQRSGEEESPEAEHFDEVTWVVMGKDDDLTQVKKWMGKKRKKRKKKRRKTRRKRNNAAPVTVIIHYASCLGPRLRVEATFHLPNRVSLPSTVPQLGNLEPKHH